MARWLYRLGVRAVANRRRVLLVWVVAVVALLGLSRGFGGEFSEDFSIPGSGSNRAQGLLADRFPELSGGSARLVFGVEDGRLDDGEARDALITTLDTVRAMPEVAIVGNPLGGMGGELSDDGRTAYVDVRYRHPIEELGSHTVDDLDRAVDVGRELGVQVELSGELPAYYQSPELGGTELMFKIGAALVIMLVAFGSVLATGLPLGLALLGLAAGVALIKMLALFVSVPSSSLLLGVMLGLGVGIDYALFIVTRHRQHLAADVDVTESIGLALATAGQAVVFAGGTVIIAIGGLTVAGIPAVTIMGASAAVVVAVMVLAAITLLPALLGFAGSSIDRFRLPGLATRTESGLDNGWGRWAQRVAARPWPYLLGSVAILLLLASPVLSLRLAMPDASTAAEGSTRRAAHELLVDGFGAGFSGPLILAVDLAPGAGETASELRAVVAADPAVARVSEVVTNQVSDTAVLQVTPHSAPQDEATQDLVHRIRNDIVPAVVGDTGSEVYVGGVTAQHVDLTDRATARLPWFMATIVGLSLILLMVVFRSVWVPVKAAAMNLLSIGVGYGAVVAVFQWGWGAGLLGLEQAVPVVSMVPMIMFAILFGLSMDYEVFLLSRTREEYLRTHDNTASVVAGVASTARVITSAALIMIVVFVGFALGDNIIIQQIGLGLAVAVLVDATIVRAALVPSTMVLLGDRNWTIPAWLDRVLPHIDIEGGDLHARADVGEFEGAA